MPMPSSDAAETEALQRASLSLAAARWALDHPDRQVDTDLWLLDEHLALDLAGIERAADQLEERAAAAFECAGDGTGPSFLAVRANLRSARSGFFTSAVGSLADFLRDHGEEVEELEIS